MEYRTFKSLNQLIIKPAVREINKETGYFVEVKQKRVGRKVAFLKFLISQPLEISSTMKTELADLNIHDLAPYCVRTRPSWRLTQRGTPHRQPRMGHSGSRGTARGQRRFRCLCRRKDRARTTCHRCHKCGRVHRQSHPRKLSKPRVPKTTSGGKSGRKTSDACLTEGRDARKAERTHPTSRACQSRIARPSRVEDYLQLRQRSVDRV